MTKPWVRLYRREEGAFAQLSLYARALAAELLKLTDDHGVIPIGRRAPHEAVAFALGATRSDRRMLKGHMEELLSDGYVVHDGDVLRVPSFPRFQATTEPRTDDAPTTPKPRTSHHVTANEPRQIHEATAEEPRHIRDRSATDPRSDREDQVKCAESLVGTDRADLDQKREEKKREEVEEIRDDDGTRRTRTVFDPAEYHTSHTLVVAAVEAFGEEYLARLRRRYTPRGHADRTGVAKLAHWVDRHVAANGGDPAEVIARIARHFVAARSLGATPPAMAWLDPDHPQYPLDPAAWLEPPAPVGVLAKRRGARGPKPPSASHPVPRDLPDIPDDEWDDPTPARSLA